MNRFLILLVQIYRWSISPIIHTIVPVRTGCRYVPTCSEYFMDTVKTEGVVAGTHKGLLRLARCQTFVARYRDRQL